MDSKRVLDLGLGLPALVVVMPVLFGAAIVMRLSGDRGPFLYRARRMGQGAQVFNVLKIRTMPVDAGGPRITVADDPRVSALGRAMRRYRIDELPQLLNVVKGEMSLVGPRPEDPSYADMSDPAHRRVFSAKPGITGLAQLAFHDEADRLVGPDAERVYRDLLLPAKLKLDTEYLERQSMLLDLEILIRTVSTVLR
jgi:lipopolysaccharide/colanic/teichoic acid biosynthesis glycosyltransferase